MLRVGGTAPKPSASESSDEQVHTYAAHDMSNVVSCALTILSSVRTTNEDDAMRLFLVRRLLSSLVTPRDCRLHISTVSMVTVPRTTKYKKMRPFDRRMGGNNLVASRRTPSLLTARISKRGVMPPSSRGSLFTVITTSQTNDGHGMP